MLLKNYVAENVLWLGSLVKLIIIRFPHQMISMISIILEMGALMSLKKDVMGFVCLLGNLVKKKIHCNNLDIKIEIFLFFFQKFFINLLFNLVN